MKAAKFYIGVFLLSFLFIIFYKLNFNAPDKIIIYHLFLIFILILGLIGVGFLMNKFKSRCTSFLYRFLWSTCLFLLITAYSLSWAGKLLLDRPIQFKIFWVYLVQLNYTIASLSIPAWQGVGFIVFLFLVFIGCFFILPKNMLSENKKIFSLLILKIKERIFVKFLLIGIGFLFLGIATFYLNKTSLIIRLAENKEPICEVFFKTNFNILGVGFLGDPETPKTRLLYPKNLSFEKKNVILIIVDALRADYLPIYGYTKNRLPFLDSLNKSGNLKKIDNVFATSANSFPCILGILRSKSWHNINEYNFSITDLLYDYGYKTNFILAGDHTNFYSLKSFFGNSISHYFDGVSSKKFYINDDNVIGESLEGIKKMDTVPNFFYFHLMSMHETGLKHKENIIYTPASAINNANNAYENNYTNGLIQLDKEIKKIFLSLKSKGYLENAIVCITADHGESLGNRGLYGHSLNVYNDVIRVPLLFFDTDTSINYSNKKYALQSDIAATFIDRIGLPVPPTWEGISLLNNEKHTLSFHTMRNHYALIKYNEKDVYKFCFNSASKKEELYNLTKDIYETENVIANTNKELLDYFREEMKKFVTHCTK